MKINYKTFFFIAFFAINIYSQSIVKMEYFIDEFTGLGKGIPIYVNETSYLDTVFTIDLSSVENGFHKLIFRSKDSNGCWSVAAIKSFYKITT